jgi:hypothetical protein
MSIHCFLYLCFIIFLVYSVKELSKVKVKVCVTSGFHHDVDQLCTLLGYHAVLSGYPRRAQILKVKVNLALYAMKVRGGIEV